MGSDGTVVDAPAEAFQANAAALEKVYEVCRLATAMTVRCAQSVVELLACDGLPQLDAKNGTECDWTVSEDRPVLWQSVDHFHCLSIHTSEVGQSPEI